MQRQVSEQDPEWEETMRLEEAEASKQEFFESWGNEELQQIQERGLELNMEARTRTLPTAEEVLNDLCQAEGEQ